MPITYDMLDGMIMTAKQCDSLWRPQMLGFSIFVLIGFLLFAIIAFYHIHKYIKLKQFVKENKLEKKYQEWKSDNKGLD